MAGRGPSPKSPERRSGHSKDPVPMRILPKLVAEQPELPAFLVETGEGLEPFRWPEQTRGWWQMWADSALAADFTSTDWSELLDAALLHARVWSGELRWLPELRLRTAKFGATPEDRARLRITFAQADEAEVSAVVKGSSARERMQGIRKAEL